MFNKRLIIIITFILLLSGCFSPMLLETQSDCKLITKELRLTLSEEGTQALLEGMIEGLFEPSDDCYSPECFLLIPLGLLAISVTSIIVSGSIVVVGNTVHWIEREGRCHNSNTRNAVNNLLNPIKNIGGKAIKSANSLSMWFKQNLSANF
ncbi:MAG TPA: hypothetical protein ENK59_06895 [Thioploca sp.]|nr:hypothetical protein [Thioploca sp.]